MKRKWLIVLVFMMLVSITAVSAHDNHTELSANDDGQKLEKTYVYDADYDEDFEDDTIITHNVVKYYGDTDTKFKVKVLDDDYEPMEGVYVKFNTWVGKERENLQTTTVTSTSR